jgi:hypothetical protein
LPESVRRLKKAIDYGTNNGKQWNGTGTDSTGNIFYGQLVLMPHYRLNQTVVKAIAIGTSLLIQILRNM